MRTFTLCIASIFVSLVPVRLALADNLLATAAEPPAPQAAAAPASGPAVSPPTHVLPRSQPDRALDLDGSAAHEAPARLRRTGIALLISGVAAAGVGTGLYFDGLGRGFGCALRCSQAPSNAEIGVGITLAAAGAGSAVAGAVLWIVGQRRLDRLRIGSETQVSLGSSPAGSLGTGLRLRF